MTRRRGLESLAGGPEREDDAAIIRRFYSCTEAGRRAAQDWDAAGWGEGEWADKVEKILAHYQKKAAKQAKKTGEAVDWREMMYQAYVQERGVDPRKVADGAASEKTGPAARQIFTELEQRQEGSERGVSTAGRAAGGGSVAQRIAERQRQVREAKKAEAAAAARRREELEMARLQQELKVAERRRKLREEESAERQSREKERQQEREQALAQRAERAGDARQRHEEEIAMQQRMAASIASPAPRLGNADEAAVPSPRSEVQSIAAVTKASRAKFKQKEAKDLEQAEREAELANGAAATGAATRVVEIITARQREAAEAAEAEEESARQTRIQKERKRLERELKWLESKRAAVEAEDRDSDQPSAELQTLRAQLDSEKAALAALAKEEDAIANGSGVLEELHQEGVEKDDELIAITQEQQEREARLVAEATQTSRARAQHQEEQATQELARSELQRRQRNEGLLIASAKGQRIAQLIADRKREAIAVLRGAEEARARASDAKRKSSVESELMRLEQRLQKLCGSSGEANSGGSDGLEELRELISLEKAKLNAMDERAALCGSQIAQQAGGWSVDEVIQRAEAEGWDSGSLRDSVAELAAASAAEGPNDQHVADATNEILADLDDEEEQHQRREAIMQKQREALAALRKAEEQDQLQLHAQTEVDHERSVQEWEAMEAQVLEAAKMGKEHGQLNTLMNELKEKYEAVQHQSAQQLLAINSLESQTYALQANWEDAEERVRRAEGEASQLRDDARQLQVRHDAALAVSREELCAAIEVQDRYSKTIEAKTAELKQLDQVRETLQGLLVRSTAESAELQKLLEALRAAELRGVQVHVKPSEKLLGSSDGGVPRVTYKFDVRLGNFQIHKFEQRYSAARTCFEKLEGSGTFAHMRPPLTFPSKMLLSDMTDSTNIAQRGEELRYYYQRLLGDPKLLCDPAVHEVLGIEKEQVDMATSASKMLLKVNVNTEMIQQVFDALPSKVTQPVAAKESSWDDVLSSAAGGDTTASNTPPRQSNIGTPSHSGLPHEYAPTGMPPGTPGRPGESNLTMAEAKAVVVRADGSSVPVSIDSNTGTPSRVRNPTLPAPAVTPSKSPAAATLEAAATLTPSRLPRDPDTGNPVALQSDTQHVCPPQTLFGLEPEPEAESEAQTEQHQISAVQLSTELQKAKAEVRANKSALAEAEQRTSDAQTTVELLHEELAQNRKELLKAWEETMALQQQKTATTEGSAPTSTPPSARAAPLVNDQTHEAEQLGQTKEQVFVLEAQLEAADAEIRRLEELLAATGDGGRTGEKHHQTEQSDGEPPGFNKAEHTLHISNLHHKVREGEIDKLFAAFGEINAIELVRDVPFSNATLEFADSTGARAALQELNGMKLNGTAISVTNAPAAVANAILEDNELAGLLASSEAEQAQQQQTQQQQLDGSSAESLTDAHSVHGLRTHDSVDRTVSPSPESPMDVASSLTVTGRAAEIATAAEQQRHAAEVKMLRSQVQQSEHEAEIAKREAQMLRRQLGILRCQPGNDEVAAQVEAEERQLEVARAELRRLQEEAAAVEERMKMRRAGLDAHPSNVVAVAAAADDEAAEVVDRLDETDINGGGSQSGSHAAPLRMRSGSDARMEAVAAIELAQERSRTQWLEQELARLTKATEQDRKYFERQLAEFAGESSARLKQQKQAARLERMCQGTYVTQYAIAAGDGAMLGVTEAPETMRRFMRISECGTYLLWGKTESDEKVIKVAIAGIGSIEIGHKTSGWKSIALAAPPTPDDESNAHGGSGPVPLPREWQCLSFVLKDDSKGTMLLSTDDDVDAALWCVGLRLILEQQEAGTPAPPAVTMSPRGEFDDGSATSGVTMAEGDKSDEQEVKHSTARSSLFDLRGRKRSII